MSGYFDGPGPEAIFRAHLAEGRFMIQRSASTGAHVFYPRLVAPGTGEADLEWVEASGEGTVYATTVNRRRPEKGGDFNVALIDLAEGPRMNASVDAPNEDLEVGMALKVAFDTVDDVAVPIFRPA